MCCVLFLFKGFAQPAKDTTNIKKLLEVTGASKLGAQVMDMMIQSYKKNVSQVPDEFWDDFRKEFDSDTLLKMVVPIYAEYYSDTEITELVAFYQTPLGKKVISVTPDIMTKSMQAGEALGKAAAEKIMTALIDKGYLNKNK